MTDIPTQYSNRDCGHIHQSLEIKKNKLVNLDLCCLFHLFHKLIRVIGYTIAPFNFEQISVFSDTRWNRVYPGSYPGRSRFNIEYASVEFPVCESKSHFSEFSSSNLQISPLFVQTNRCPDEESQERMLGGPKG